MPPKIISIEANIGAGKSTLLSNLASRGFTVAYEPVEEWTRGENILQRMYEDPKRLMLSFQCLTLTTRDHALREVLKQHTHKDNVIFVERAPGLSDLHIFVKLAMRDGNLTPLVECIRLPPHRNDV